MSICYPLDQKTGKHEEDLLRRWRCTICGYIHDGDQPPYQCPICRAPAAMFEEIKSPDLEGSGKGNLPDP